MKNSFKSAKKRLGKCKGRVRLNQYYCEVNIAEVIYLIFLDVTKGLILVLISISYTNISSINLSILSIEAILSILLTIVIKAYLSYKERNYATTF